MTSLLSEWGASFGIAGLTSRNLWRGTAVAPMTVDVLLARLDGVRQTGTTTWIAQCPAHDDRRPSLSTRIVANRRVRLYDHVRRATDGALDAAVGRTT